MSLYTKPTVLPAWAEAAGTADLTAPASSFIQAGWPSSTTPPARQYFNWVLNYASVGVRYYMQNGLPLWDAAETYPAGAVLRASDQSLWQARVQNINQNPLASSGFWNPLPYVTAATLTSTLSAYTTLTTLSSTLTGYVTNSALATTLTGYPTNSVLASTLTAYVMNSSLATTLTGYVSNAALTTALAAKANLASPALSGTPTTPTAAPGNNSTQIASTAFIQAALAAATSATMASFGHWKDPNTGFKVNWGTIYSVPGATSGGPVSFESPFTTACYGVICGFNGGNLLFNVTSFGLSSFNWQTYGSAATANVMWFAFGK